MEPAVASTVDGQGHWSSLGGDVRNHGYAPLGTARMSRPVISHSQEKGARHADPA